MEVRLLGPLEVSVGGRHVQVTSAKQRIVLATLALRANQLVSVEDLIDRLWDGAPPATARATLHNHVMRLRKLTTGPDLRSPLRTRSPGYVLDAEPGTVDVQVFARLLADAVRAKQAGDLAAEATLLRSALDVWRGPALQDVPSDRMREEDGGMWAERHAQAVERRIQVDLALGRHAEVVGELRGLVRAHPLREGLREQLILALYAGGRRAEALDAYAEARHDLVEQLGVEPGRGLRELHARLLAEEPADDPADPADPVPAGESTGGARVRPAELPRDVPRFVGRRAELDRLASGLAGGLIVVSGIAGVGKTALAVHWAHAMADRFPDGQFYLDLRGFDPAHEPLAPELALMQLLRRLGADTEQLTGNPAEQAAVYRSLLAQRRCLLLLDNARSAAQVRPLLPGAGGSLALITSRNRLGELVALDGAVPVPLGVLSDVDATGLLLHTMSVQRDNEDNVELAELARLCGHLPLALRIVAANLIAHPHTRVADLVAELAEGDRLAGLTVDGAEQGVVAQAFGLSYQSLPAEPARLFRRLGLVPGPDFTPLAAAALTGTTVTEAGRLLAALAGANLIEQHQPGRYRMHDLLCQFAADRMAEDEPAGAELVARSALFDHYLDWADAAGRRINPGYTRIPLEPRAGAVHRPVFDDVPSAVDWFAAERANLVAAVEHAERYGPTHYTWYLADALRSYFVVSTHVGEWRLTAERGLRAARSAGHQLAQAGMELNLGAQAIGVTNFTRAIEYLRKALYTSTAAGWDRGLWAATQNLGALLEHTGRPREALTYTRRSAEITAGKGAAGGEALANASLGLTYWGLGELDNANRHVRLALRLSEEAGQELAIMSNLGDLGFVEYEQGLLDEAEPHLVAALASYRRLAPPASLPDFLSVLAWLRHDRGDVAGAMAYAVEAFDLAQQFAEPEPIATALCALAAAHLAAGEAELAMGYQREALAAAARAASTAMTMDALIGLSRSARVLGDFRASVAAANQARAIGRRTGSLLRQIRAETTLAQVYRDLGKTAHALRWVEHASALAAPTGARLLVVVLAGLRDELGD